MAEAKDSFRTAIDACFENADELMRGSRQLAANGLHRLAYHLAVLALEEVGKSSILSMGEVARKTGREVPASIARGVSDHVRKLFWAIWGPSMGRELITKEQIESSIGLAQGLHDKRVSGLYVDSDETGISVPMGAISSEETESLLRFVGACIELERPSSDKSASGPTEEDRKRQEWFFEATEDPERRRLIMGGSSMRKLKELGSVPEWVKWLRKTFEDNETESRAALERELQRKPDPEDRRKPKWRVTIRLFTPSHSIRQKVLNDVNKGLDWVQFRAVSGKPDQLLVDLQAPSDVTVDHVWRSSHFMSRRLVMALNVATLGFFWFHEVLDRDKKQSGKFYEELRDLESKSEIRAHRSPSLRLEFGTHARALDAQDLHRWTLCYVHLLAYRGKDQFDVCERYLDALAMIAKSDVHMAFEIQAMAAFYIGLKGAMRDYGDWKDEPFPEALKRFAADAIKLSDDEHLDRLCAVGESVNTGQPALHAMNMNDVGVMKALCDVYLIRTFQKLGPPGRSESADTDQAVDEKADDASRSTGPAE